MISAVREQVVDSPSGEQSGKFHPRASDPLRARAGRAETGRPEGWPSGARSRLPSLARTIELEIIPRLVLAHRGQNEVGRGLPAVGSNGASHSFDVVGFANLVLTCEAEAASAYLAALRERGAEVESLYLDLLAPAAQHLGRLWEEDLCDFTQVTIGLWRLQQVMHAFSPAFQNEINIRGRGRRALLVPAPGEQHTFGLAMVSEFFRRAGWTVWSGVPDTMPEMLAMVRREWFAVVGFSVACGAQLDALAAAIRKVRRASRNRALGVMVGGPLFIEHPELVALVGADATAADGRQAVLQAHALLTLLAERS